MGRSMVDYSHWKTPIAGNPPTMPEDGLQHPHEKPKFEKKGNKTGSEQLTEPLCPDFRQYFQTFSRFSPYLANSHK